MKSIQHRRLAGIGLFCAAIVGAGPVMAQSSAPAPAATAPPARTHGAAQHAARAQDPHRTWMTNHRWRYASEARAEAAYQALLTRDSRWPDWHQVNVVTLPAGLRFQMALAAGQAPDHPGAFGTFDRITSAGFVRRELGMKDGAGPAIDRAVTYEVTSPLSADVGTAAPQIDAQGHRYLPGGASQLEITIPAGERMQHLRVIQVRPIH